MAAIHSWLGGRDQAPPSFGAEPSHSRASIFEGASGQRRKLQSRGAAAAAQLRHGVGGIGNPTPLLPPAQPAAQASPPGTPYSSAHSQGGGSPYAAGVQASQSGYYEALAAAPPILSTSPSHAAAAQKAAEQNLWYESTEPPIQRRMYPPLDASDNGSLAAGFSYMDMWQEKSDQAEEPWPWHQRQSDSYSETMAIRGALKRGANVRKNATVSVEDPWASGTRGRWMLEEGFAEGLPHDEERQEDDIDEATPAAVASVNDADEAGAEDLSPSGIYDPRLSVRNTFIHAPPTRSPSLERFVEERRAQSMPPILKEKQRRTFADLAGVLRPQDEICETPLQQPQATHARTKSAPCTPANYSKASWGASWSDFHLEDRSEVDEEDANDGLYFKATARGDECAEDIAALVEAAAECSASSSQGSGEAAPASGSTQQEPNSAKEAKEGTSGTSGPSSGASGTSSRRGSGASSISTMPSSAQETIALQSQWPRPPRPPSLGAEPAGAAENSLAAAACGRGATYAPAAAAAPGGVMSAGGGIVARGDRGRPPLQDAASALEEMDDDLPSKGSALHNYGKCKPCAFVFQEGCKNDIECPFCHLCEPGERKRRKKERMTMRREARLESRRLWDSIDTYNSWHRMG